MKTLIFTLIFIIGISTGILLTLSYNTYKEYKSKSDSLHGTLNTLRGRLADAKLNG